MSRRRKTVRQSEGRENVGVWTVTKRKLETIATRRRWTLSTTIDELADHFMRGHPDEFAVTIAGETPAPPSENQLPERRSA